MDDVAITYEQWVENVGRESEWGAQAIVTDKMRQRYDGAMVKMADMMSRAMVKSLKENGNRYGSMSVEVERDVLLRGDDVFLLIEATQGDLPVEYLGMAYQAWQSEQLRRINWENKSLWGYIRHWWER